VLDARWLNAAGIAGFVLKYRLGSSGYRHPAMLHDAARAVRTVRARAAEWDVDPRRVGIMGSSAGGHLASTLMTHFDDGAPAATDPVERQSSRPDLGILCYAVITTGEHGHAGSKENLLGPDPAPALAREVSNELQVTPRTPPAFVWHTLEDPGVPMENSVLFAQALRAAGVPFELHIYERGAHGIGLGTHDYEPERFHHWTRDCLAWLRSHGWGEDA
jgi:acetyl esterase/lipase